MFKIANRNIGKDYKPFIIAELSANHGGAIDRAKASILAANAAGASAVKIQSYTPKTMTIDCDKKDFKIEGGLWNGYSLYQLYSEAYTPFEWHEELFDFAKKRGIVLFSSPFDETAVDLLERLDTPAYKIASFELTDLPLIEYVSKKQKPILISTGMASLEEIAEALETVRYSGNKDVLLFHCISSYPATTESSNLNNLTYLAKEFDVEVGLSDHSMNNLAAISSIALGGVAIEKHFKLDETDCGPDSSFSLLPNQLSLLVKDCEQVWLAKGKEEFSRSKEEKENVKFRRSLYFIRNCKKGHIITKNDIRRIRPGFGLPPKYYDQVLGSELTSDVTIGTPVKFEQLK